MTRCRPILAFLVVLLGLVSCAESQEPSTVADRLAEILGVPLDSEGLVDREELRFARTQELVAQCMTSLGFEYIPLPADPTVAKQINPAEDGFGLATVLARALVETQPEIENPNFPALSQMTEAEREAWIGALEGPDVNPLNAAEAAENLFDPDRTLGCQSEALVLVADESDRNALVFDAYYQALSTAPSDLRVISAQDTWPGCMAAKGYDIANESQAYNSISEELVQLTSNFAGLDLDGQGRPVLTPRLQSDLDRLANREVLVASASYSCREPERAAYSAVIAEIELEFVDSYNG